MARSPKPSNAPTSVSTPRSTPAPLTRTRARPSATPSAPSTPAATTPDGPSTSRTAKPVVEAKAHGLRSVLGERERAPCPFPAQFGGREKCGILEEDEKDEVLMATCAACAALDNRALSADEIAAIAIDEGWLRPPSAAVVPATIINNAIRAHIKRCTSATPPRPALLMKHQLAGSVNESVLESALHPNAFAGQVRPKGTVWFLAPMGKSKWKNPFTGIEVPKLPPRKPGPPKKVKEIRAKPPAQPTSGSEKKKVNKAQASSTPAPAPVKIRLVLGGQNNADVEDNVSEAENRNQRGRSGSRRRSTSTQGPPSAPASVSINRLPTHRHRDVLDSSDESDTSDSDMDLDIGPSRMIKLKSKKPAPVPISASNPARSTLHSNLSRNLGSPYLDWGNAVLPASPTLPNSILPQPQNSPFPSHSLDNTTWTVRRDLARHDIDRLAAFETSSSSSDDDLREWDTGDWGMSSGILVQADQDGQDVKPMWTAEDEEAKVKEATDALRVLFPMSSPEDEVEDDPQLPLNQLDNRPTPAETPNGPERTPLRQFTRGSLKSADLAASIALAAWVGNSSPVASPNLRSAAQTLPEASPTQHLSKLHDSFNSADMEVDEWLDEAGELPVKAEDTFSDIDVGSTVGDLPTPEHDRQLHTAAWAREAAASTSFQVKEEPHDYPSPLPTEPDEGSRGSRDGSTESQTPSSGLSELPPFELDYECVTKPDIEEVLVGPESISMEELEGYLPSMGRTEKTPQRGRHSKSSKHSKDRSDVSCSGLWGGIGVGIMMGSNPASPRDAKQSPLLRQRSARASARRRRSSTRVPQLPIGAEQLPTPPTDEEPPMKARAAPAESIDGDFEAIGPADFDAACAEAEAREEKHRRACREKAERQKAILEAYDQSVKERQMSQPSADATPAEWDGAISPWSDLPTPWGTSSTESLGTPGVLSPMALHSMSVLSLDAPRMYQAMDPKSLLSPPLIPVPGMLDEVMSQAEVEAAMIAVNPPAPAPASAPASAAPTVPTTSPSTTTASTPIPIAPAPVPAKATTGKAQTVTPPSSSSPALRPANIAPKAASATQTPAAPQSAPAAPGRARASPKNTDASKKPISPSGSKPASQAGPTKSQGTITKPLCHGVDACVVDNIPVYAHVWENKGVKHTLLRRLDTDFVNATSLLSALGVPVAKHQDHLAGPSPWHATHLTVPTQCASNGVTFSPGVPGVWVQFAEARALAKKLQPPDGNFLTNILREDLFQLFAELASINPEHQPSEQFGLPFIVGKITQNGNGNSFSSSSANSKSAPNLPSLSSSAPSANHLRPGSKGPLVRSTPATPSDAVGPQPKRRRATTCVVGEVAPLSKIAPAPSTTSTPIRKPPPRAARPSSLAAEAPKQKVAAK